MLFFFGNLGNHYTLSYNESGHEPFSQQGLACEVNCKTTLIPLRAACNGKTRQYASFGNKSWFPKTELWQVKETKLQRFDIGRFPGSLLSFVFFWQADTALPAIPPLGRE